MPNPYAPAVTLHKSGVSSYLLDIVDTDKFIRGKCLMPKVFENYEIEERLAKDLTGTLSVFDYVVEDVETDTLPFELDHISSIIEEAQYIVHLEQDWDSEGALPISKITFEKAISFVKSYSLALYEIDIVIVAPVISPLSDGSIDILWQTHSNSLLANIKSGKEVAYFYGVYDINGEKDHFNGKVTLSSIKTFFSDWLEGFQMEERTNS